MDETLEFTQLGDVSSDAQPIEQKDKLVICIGKKYGSLELGASLQSPFSISLEDLSCTKGSASAMERPKNPKSFRRYLSAGGADLGSWVTLEFH